MKKGGYSGFFVNNNPVGHCGYASCKVNGGQVSWALSKGHDQRFGESILQ
jgi:hypothetical protein